MAGTPRTTTNKSHLSIHSGCPLNLLSRDIWVRVAMKAVSNSIWDLFNMQATCKVFLDVARLEVVYKHASMWDIPLVTFLFHSDRPERRFIDHCVGIGNLDAILRDGMTEYFWISHRDIGMKRLNMAASEGSIEACYLSAMLLLCNHKDDVDKRHGAELFKRIVVSGEVERCREVFTDIFEQRWVDEKPSDPGEMVACRCTGCPTRGTMGVVQDVSSVSCVHCLAGHEVRVFLEMFTFE